MSGLPISSVTEGDQHALPTNASDYGTQDANGVDLSLLHYMLSLSPLERLQQMERHARDIQLLMDYGRRAREAKTAGDC